MKKTIVPIKRKYKPLKLTCYEHLGNGYYRDMVTGKIYDKSIKQLIENKNHRLRRLK
jgi:hypothetical protein